MRLQLLPLFVVATLPIACASVVSTEEDKSIFRKIPHLLPPMHARANQAYETAPMPREVPDKALHATQGDVGYRLRNIAAADAAPIVKKFLVGNQLRAALTTDQTTNTINVSGEPRNRDMVVELLASLDAQPEQLQIQVLVVQVPTGFLADIGLTDDTPGIPIRTLKPNELNVLNVQLRMARSQGSLEVLSRLMVQVKDNQPGFIWAGADCPELATRPVPGPGLAYATEEYTGVGVMLRMIPRIKPEGNVLLRFEPSISVPNPKPGDAGSGYRPPTIEVKTEPGTVLISDGQTVVLHGLSVPRLQVYSKHGTIKPLTKKALDGKKGELIFFLTPSVVSAGSPPVIPPLSK